MTYCVVRHTHTEMYGDGAYCYPLAPLCAVSESTGNEKSAQRDANTASVGAVVRFGHCPPVTNTPTNTRRHRQD